MDTVIRYTKFCSVGTSGVVVDMAFLYFLLGVHPSPLWLNVSKIIAAEGAILNNFTWNDVWTFPDLPAVRNSWKERLRRFLKFNLICTTGIGLSVLLLNIQVYGLHLNVYLANVISIILVSVWNYGWSARFGWKVGGRQEPSTGP